MKKKHSPNHSLNRTITFGFIWYVLKQKKHRKYLIFSVFAKVWYLVRRGEIPLYLLDIHFFDFISQMNTSTS